MSKPFDTKLFDLVQSLSSSEKRYISLRVYNKGDKQKIYHTIFKELLKQKSYDEIAIKRKIQIKDIQQFHVYKNYLFNLILELIGNYNQNKTIRGKVNQLIFETKYLLKKGIIKEALNRLKKAKKISLKYELFYSALEICKLEIQLHASELKTNQLSSSLSEVFKLEQEILFKLSKLTELNQLATLLGVQLNSPKLVVHKKNIFIRKTLKNPLLNEEINSFQFQILKHFILSESYEQLSNTELSYIHNKKQLDIFYENPHIINFSSTFYFSVLINFISKNISLKKYKRVKTYLEELRLKAKEGKNINLSLMFYYYEFITYINIKSNLIDVAFLNQIETFSLKYASKISIERKEVLSILIFSIYYHQKEFKKLSRKLMSFEIKSDYKNINYRLWCILNFMVQYDYKNEDIY